MCNKIILFIIVTIFWGGGVAAAQNVMCGKDLRNTISAQSLKKIEEAASKIKNGSSRFWKIEKDGIAPSYLFGTMHASDKKIIEISEVEQEAFKKSDRVVLELIEDLSLTEQKLMVIMQNSNLLFFEEDNNISSLLTSEQFEKFNAALNRRGFSYSSLERVKPWFFAMIFVYPDCPKGHDNVLDLQLQLYAEIAGKELIGLETLEEQIKSLAALPDSFYIAQILESIEKQEQVKDFYHTSGELYSEGNIAMINALNDYIYEDVLTSSDLQEFEDILLNKRNVIMAERAKPLLEKGNNFIAVGAMHLIGETGLIESFRKMGYRVSALH